ncbi:MAG: hypothetical protein IPJ27_12170 [Candidatus Accumulibacter sp.]|uniref:Uncharacterized protein n=1 Tax=Candidatus Accumulibacter proximus TaxID=2954385 RepID=A0A935UHE7_9PROT|nr:hypothetical protein [Candidatus Accumulibacter proximus]
MHTHQRTEVDRFLASGHYDNGFETWPGDTFVERATCGSAALRCALISEVLQRTGCAAVPAFLENADLKVFAHAKLAPMVQGLFPQRERMIVLERLERSVVFLTPATIASTFSKKRLGSRQRGIWQIFTSQALMPKTASTMRQILLA